MTSNKIEIKTPDGKLGVLIPGLGAVSTTFIAGVMMIRRGLNKPIGSLSQMGKIRTGSGENAKEVDIKDFISLATLKDMEFGGWDIFEDTVYESAKNAQVLTNDDIESVKEELSSIKPWKAVFNRHFVKNLDGKNVKEAPTHWDLVQMVKDDITKFKQEKNISRFVMVWCGSTEIYQEMIPGVHDTLANFEKALKENHPSIAPSMIYCYVYGSWHTICKRCAESLQ